MFKRLMKQLFIGIGMGSTILTIGLFILQLVGADHMFDAITNNFIRQSMCCIFVSTIFNVLAIIYDTDRFHMGIKVLIHMGGGLLIYFPVAFYAGWIPLGFGIGPIISTIIFILIFSFCIWLGYFLYYYFEAKKINAQITRVNTKK
ncbi:MAG: DUF3021 domain-containing protein [Cellulosilyticaceae bacterium]